jgi:hypothetical protein
VTRLVEHFGRAARDRQHAAEHLEEHGRGHDGALALAHLLAAPACLRAQEARDEQAAGHEDLVRHHCA